MTPQGNEDDPEREENRMSDINQFLEEKFKDEAFAREYYRQATFYRLADQVLLLRKERGLTQVELAEKAGTTQAVISRLENVSVRPSMDTITRIAQALDAVVEVRLKPMEELGASTAKRRTGAGQNKTHARRMIHTYSWEMHSIKSQVDPLKKPVYPYVRKHADLSDLPFFTLDPGYPHEEGCA